MKDQVINRPGAVAQPEALYDLQGIILAGVHAWGENALERICSRPLLPVAGWPLVSYLLGWFRENGVVQASVCANSDTRRFRRWLGDGQTYDLSIDYYEDLMPRGPAGCMRDAAMKTAAKTLVVVDGTILTQVDLGAVLEAHRQSHAALTVVCTGDRTGGPPHACLEPAGMYIVSREALERVPGAGYQDIKEGLIPRLYAQGLCVAPYVVDRSTTVRLTCQATYLAVMGRVVEQLTRRLDPTSDYRRDNGACIHRSARVHPKACLVGPVLVGPGSTVAEGALVVGPTCIAAGCTVGRRSVIRRSALLWQSRVGALAIVQDSILADGSHIEPELVVRDTLWLPAESARARRLDQSGHLYWRLPQPAGGAGRKAPAAAQPMTVS